MSQSVPTIQGKATSEKCQKGRQYLLMYSQEGPSVKHTHSYIHTHMRTHMYFLLPTAPLSATISATRGLTGSPEDTLCLAPVVIQSPCRSSSPESNEMCD